MDPYKEFHVYENAYKPEQIDLSDIFSLGYFISEQIFNLNGKSKFEEVDSLKEKKNIAMFFKDKAKYPQDLETYHLYRLNIQFIDDDYLRRCVVPDRTIYLVDGVELDYEKLKSKDLVIEMGLDWNAIIIMRDYIIESFDSLSKNTNFVPNCEWLYLLGSFIYEETFEDLVDYNIFTDGIWIENLIYSCVFYILNGNKHFPDKLMRFIKCNEDNLFKSYIDFCNNIEDITKVMVDPEIQSIYFPDQLDLAERMINIKKRNHKKNIDLAFAKEELKKIRNC